MTLAVRSTCVASPMPLSAYGSLKFTCSARSGVIVRPAAMMSISPDFERRNEAIDVVGEELRLDVHVGRELARDVDLEADELAVGAARGPRSEQRYADAQRAGIEHVLEIARRGVPAERRLLSYRRRYSRHACRSATAHLRPAPLGVGSAL